ncbi:MAG: ribosome small subunit-dependent GTPase A [Bacteroidota bacterium]|nr:ribosome small subunit-dependent GTPase A [Bacteroidota bacterium]
MNEFTAKFENEKKEWESKGFSVARIAAEHKGRYSILLDEQFLSAEITGKMMFAAETRKDYPAVGDWVAAQLYEGDSPAIIHHVLPRRTVLSRKSSGREIEEQIIATNMDIVFVVQGLDNNYNLRRLERFLVVASQSGAVPIILLSKTDLLTEEQLKTILHEVQTISENAQTIFYSAKTLYHLDEIKKLISKDSTVCFIGSSGAGKSTLINRLIGREKLHTQEVREDDSRGKHTTTHRELIPLESGGCVIDTPGLREIGLWEVGSSVEETFPDIAELSLQCKFTDCTHAHEPGCAVQSAIEDGYLDPERYESFLKLKKEAEFIESKSSVTKQQERKAREKKLGKDIKAILKMKGKK